MPTKLKNLKIKRVALVDEGANPDAFVRFAKAKDPEPDEAERGLMQRIISTVQKAFGIEPVDKGAHTFGEAESQRDYNKVIDAEIYPMNWAFMDSVRSILLDADIDEPKKETLLKQTLMEFSETYNAAAAHWAKAECSKEAVAKDNDLLVKMRDSLNDLIDKSGCGGKEKNVQKVDDPEDIKDDPEEPNDDEDGDEPVEKGVESDMKFDTSKMNPEELAVYTDLAKRFGTEETNPAPVAQPEQHEPDGNDVYKGLHPAVKAELESLRKFREDAEDRQLMDVAKRYTIIGKKPEELLPVLKSLKAAGGTAYADMINVLDSAVAAVEGSGVFDEIGKRGGENTGDAWGKIEQAAHDIMKSKPETRWADAIDAACVAHPELVEEYEKSRR